MNYQLHPLCSIFPRLQGLDFDDLCRDIKVNGLLEPIVLLDGQILDGGNRYKACQTVGLEPSFVEFDGDDPAAFVLSKNFYRRHLVPGQHATLVALTTKWADAHGVGTNQHSKAGGSATLQTLKSTADRASVSGVSVRTQSMADKVAKADPDLALKVAHGEVSLPKAVKQVEAKNPPKPKKKTTVATETASPVTPEQRAPGPVETKPAEDDALGDFDPVAELQRVMGELEAAQALVKAAEADDLKAEAMKWRRAYDHAQREQSIAMDRYHNEAKLHKFKHRQLMRCGKAVGEEDPDKVASAVEAFVRMHKVAA